MSENQPYEARPIYLAWALLSCSVLLGACGDGDETVHSVPIEGCESLDVTPCDTRERACQSSRLQIAACLRETTAASLPLVNVMTEQSYADNWNAMNAESVRFVGTNHFEVAMTWIGLAQPGAFGYVPVTAETVQDWFGTYRWRHKDLVVIDHGKPADDAASNVELVAALIRALRDRDVEIGPWSTRVAVFDLDSNWGADAMYFGEARFYANRYRDALKGRALSAADEFSQINANVEQDVAWMVAQPSPYLATLSRFSDNFGSRAMSLAWQRGGVPAINELWESKLLTHQLMASETEEGKAPPLKYHARPRAPEGWDQDPIVTALGAWGLFLTLTRHLPTETAWSIALGWRGDQLFVFDRVDTEDTSTGLVWQIETADENAAALLEEELRAVDPSVRVGRTGTFVTLARADLDGSLDWAFVTDE